MFQFLLLAIEKKTRLCYYKYINVKLPIAFYVPTVIFAPSKPRLLGEVAHRRCDGEGFIAKTALSVSFANSSPGGRALCVA